MKRVTVPASGTFEVVVPSGFMATGVELEVLGATVETRAAFVVSLSGTDPRRADMGVRPAPEGKRSGINSVAFAVPVVGVAKGRIVAQVPSGTAEVRVLLAPLAGRHTDARELELGVAPPEPSPLAPRGPGAVYSPGLYGLPDLAGESYLAPGEPPPLEELDAQARALGAGWFLFCKPPGGAVELRAFPERTPAAHVLACRELLLRATDGSAEPDERLETGVRIGLACAQRLEDVAAAYPAWFAEGVRGAPGFTG